MHPGVTIDNPGHIKVGALVCLTPAGSHGLRAFHSQAVNMLLEGQGSEWGSLWVILVLRELPHGGMGSA